MGQALRLALAGIRARAASSVAVLLVLVVALAGAVIGPVFLRAADESAVRRAVQDGPAASRLVAVQTNDTSRDAEGALATARRDLAADAELAAVLRPGIAGRESTTASALGDVLPVVSRDDLCAHLELRSGRCPASAGEVVMAEPLPMAEGWRLGGRTELTPGGAVTIVGTYAPIDVGTPYWSGHGYDPADAVGDPRDPKRRLGAAFTLPGTLDGFAENGGRQRAVLDLPLDAGRVTAGNAETVRTELARWTTELYGDAPDVTVTTGLGGALADARDTRAGLRLPVLLVVGQLLLLSLLVLGLVVEGTSTARAPEVALAKLRGLGPWRVAAFGLLDVVLLVVAALPPALALGVLAARLAGAGRFAEGTPVVLTGDAVVCGAAAVLGAVLVAAWAGREALRTPASELLRTTAPRRRSGTGALLAVGVLAAAGAAELTRGGGLRSDRLDVVALATPGALTLAVALLGSRLLPLACRALVPLTRLRGPVAAFLAVRQLARRPAGGRSVVVLATALGLAAFAVSASSVQDRNRHDRALADNGAPTVYGLQTDPGTDLQQVVRTVDPGGHSMAVLSYDSPASSPGERRLLAVDSSRLAAVSFWRADLADGGVRDVAAALAPPVQPPVLVQGDAVRISLDVQDRTPPPPPRRPDEYVPAGPDPASLVLELDGASGLRLRLDLGPVGADGPRTITRAVSGCSVQPCRVRALRLTRVLGTAPVAVALTVRELAGQRGGSWAQAPGALAPERWRVASGAPTAVAGGLSAVLFGASGQEPALTVADHPAQLPAVVTSTGFHVQGRLQVPGLDAQDSAATEVARAAFLPGAGADAALVDLTAADRAAAGTRSGLVTPQVWVAVGAPADLPARLAAAGVRVVGTSTAATREQALARQGPALAVRLLLLAGATATALAAAGASLSLALLAQRRRYELAALEAAGVGRRSLSVSVLGEQVVLLATAAVLGVAAGLAGGRLAARSVPQFDDVDPGLPLLASPRPAAVAAALGVALLAVLVVGLLSGAVLLRGRGVERLREAQA